MRCTMWKMPKNYDNVIQVMDYDTLFIFEPNRLETLTSLITQLGIHSDGQDGKLANIRHNK